MRLRRRASIVLVTLCAIGLLLPEKAFAKTFTHKYKLTVTVETDGVKRSGASIIEVNWIEQPQKAVPIPVPRYFARVAGDAPVVDLANGGAIVATLQRADQSYRPIPLEYLAAKAFHLADSDASIPDLERLTGVRVLSGNEIPTLVYFSDRTDPSTATLVGQPVGSGGQLAPGVTLVGVTIEITSASVARALEQSLPWWSRPGRPAEVALLALRQGNTTGESVEPERLFRR